MADMHTFLVFLAAALLVAVTPGTGILYVAARTLAGDRSEGLASSVGLALGGLVHVFAGAVGISALIMASAEAFTMLKIAGALYLVWLGLETWREARIVEPAEVKKTGAHQAFRDGIIVEALNPKTAAFFVAFIPQFIDPTWPIAHQFFALGLISVSLTTVPDLVVTYWAAIAHGTLENRPALMMRARQASGAVMCTLGASLLFARRSA